MLRYSINRFLRSIFAIWGVVTIVFFVPRMIGDPVVIMLPIDAEEADVQLLRQDLGLDKPIVVQYGVYVSRMLVGDLGDSYLFREPALDVLLRRFPVTMQLASAAVLWAVIVGIPLGILSAVKRGTLLDSASRTFAVLGLSAPSYFTALLLILFFSVKWQIFPIRGPDTGLASLHQIILPSIALGWGVVGPIVRLTRSSMLEILDADFIAMAHMKGLPERVVLYKHALRNAIIPVFTYMSIVFASLLGGVVIIEWIFAWPGIGSAAIQGINSWDFPLVQAATILGSIAFITINYIVDISYGLVDPRIRY